MWGRTPKVRHGRPVKARYLVGVLVLGRISREFPVACRTPSMEQVIGHRGPIVGVVGGEFASSPDFEPEERGRLRTEPILNQPQALWGTPERLRILSVPRKTHDSQAGGPAQLRSTA